ELCSSDLVCVCVLKSDNLSLLNLKFLLAHNEHQALVKMFPLSLTDTHTHTHTNTTSPTTITHTHTHTLISTHSTHTHSRIHTHAHTLTHTHSRTHRAVSQQCFVVWL